MIYKLIRLIGITGLWLLCFYGSSLADQKIQVFVSISPQKYFLEKIGKDRLSISVLVAPGANPHTYEPKPRQMVDIAAAKIYFALGVPFEDVWLKRLTAANPGMKVVRTDEGITKIPMDTVTPIHNREKPDPANHRHETDDHNHSGLDPHIWLSPDLVKIQAGNMMAALVQADPGNKNAYEQNYQQFIKEIEALNESLKSILSGKAGCRFMVFHPSWGYFAQAFGLKQIPVEVEGKSPTPAQLAQLIDLAKKMEIRIIFAQPQFSTKSAQLIAQAIGGDVILSDPLAENWAETLLTHSTKLRDGLK